MFQSQKLKKLIELYDSGSESLAARRSDLSQTTISELLLGKTTSPQQKTLEKLSAYYKVHKSFWYTPDAALPDEVPDLPPELSKLLLTADIKPYLVLLPEIKKSGIPPHILKKIIEEWSKPDDE
ncbi:MAG: hypothetical protein H6Q74_2573 [Firmicutes bacterium]|nr:hypothetical protein [Bacillota bacterium]